MILKLTVGFLYLNFVCAQIESEKPTGITGTCGAEISGPLNGFIASPGYPLTDYPDNVNCVYEIVAPQPNQVIGYKSVYMSLEPKDVNTSACYDHVTLFRSERGVPDVFCGNENIPNDVTFGPRLTVEFFSDESIVSDGFVISWFVIDPNELKPSLNCDFDGPIELCAGWQQFDSDGFDWSFTRGETPSSDTGPFADHTTGKMNEGRYAHIEASGVGRGSTAVLLTPTFYSDVEYCLEFWYHMLGDGLPQLNVIQTRAQDKGNILKRIEKINHGNWTKFQHLLTPVSQNISIAFEAVRGSNYRSDLAIDDVTFTRGSCVTMTTEERCMVDEFECSNPADGCISKLFRCDGTRDCNDGSDEIGCKTLPTKCLTNMIFSTCAPACNRTCDDGLVGKLCKEDCVERCTCPIDYPILYNNTCIEQRECPGNNPKFRQHLIEEVQDGFARLFNHITDWITSQKS